MARADLLLDLVRAGTQGNQALFRKSLEALIAEERTKQHHVLAEQLERHLNANHTPSNAPPYPPHRNKLNTELFHEISPERHLESLILPPQIMKISRELITEYQRTDLLRAYNLEPRHRILITGPPGNGKTSLAEALATELVIPLLVVRYESVITSFLGETAVRISQLFEQVRTRRCVLFFDEFDVVGKERSDPHETGEIKRVVSSLLLQIDHLPSHVFVIAATNHPELLDRAVERRFQAILALPTPSPNQAQEWFQRFEKRLGEQLSPTPATLAKHLKGLSFSELEHFTLDIQRQYVLTRPESNLRAITAERLQQWQERLPATKPTTQKTNG